MKKIHLTLDALPLLEKRLAIFVNTIAIIAIILIIRFWFLQIVYHPYYLDLAEKNRIRNLKIPAPRGTVYDREGEVIASSAPTFHLEIIREELVNKDEIFHEIAKIFNKTVEDVLKDFSEKSRITPKFYPVILYDNLERNQIIAIEALKWKLKGVKISYKSERSYPYKNFASHLLGHVSQITAKDIEKLKKSYPSGSKIGKYGLEKELEDYIRGFDGVEKVEVDAAGRKKKVLYKLDPISGGSVKLTIDWKVQEAAERAMGDKNGAVVALSPKTGEIFAITSHPNFDPNLFVKGFHGNEWEKIIKNPYHPLQNKAIQGIFPPGSTFKLITAIAGLEEGIITKDSYFFCNGKKRVGNRDFRCWKDSGHGRVDVHKALVESCDVFFYEVALKLGAEKLAKYAKMLGLGEKTGINLPGELSGIVPSPQWKRDKFNKPWYNGDTLPFAIGQGYLSISPIQLAVAYATFANGGYLLTPTIIKEIEVGENKKVTEDTPKIKEKISFKPETIDIVRKGLIGVVNEPSGTGKASRVEDIVVAGKTGTAQVRAFKDRTKLSGFLNDHAWFVAFAPAYDPEIAVAVFVMHGGHGGGVAAPVAKEVIESFFNRNKTNAKRNIQDQ